MARYLTAYLFFILVLNFGLGASVGSAQGYADDDSVVGDFDGRGYILDGSYSRGKKRRPLIIFLHGGFGNADKVRRVLWRGMRKITRRRGVMVAYLNGSPIGFAGRRKKWNAGQCCGRKSYAGNDVKYIRQFIRYAVKRYKADRNRIYLMGHSNGGMMAYRYICEVQESVAAVVVIAGTLMTDNCAPDGVRGILHIHGDEDRRVRIEGGPARFPGARGLEFRSLRFTHEAFDKMGVPFQAEVLRGVGHGLREIDYDADLAAMAWRFFRGKRLR